MSAQPHFAPFEIPLSVPLALSSRKNWIGWRALPNRDDPSKIDKVPAVLVPGVPVNDYLKPHAHVTYDEAIAQVGPLRLSGVGFVMTLDCGMIGGDMDGCRDPATGVIEPWAQAIIDRKETYFEISPSGRGVRFFSLTDVPLRETITFKPAGVELYSKLRYLTFTGVRILGTPLEIRRAPYAVEKLMARVADAKAASKPSGAPASQSQPGAPSGSFEDVSDRAANRKSPMGKINEAAMADFDAWVPELLPEAEKTADGGYRVKSVDLGRPNQEDLSLSPSGIKDFGVHDLGDPREGRRTPIDVVMEWSVPPLSSVEAATWLGVRVGVPFGGPSTGSSGGSQPSPEDLKAVDEWNAALARLRAAAPRPAFAVGAATDTALGRKFDPSHTGPSALRPGVTDRLTRGFVASVSSAANAGKSTYLGSEAVAIACERADVLGLPALDWCGHVAIVSNEEDENTLTSRWRGVMKAHGLAGGDFRHEIFIWPTRERLRIGRGGKDRRVTPTPEGVRFVIWLAELAEAGQPVAVLGIDTLVSVFEGVDENSADMDKAMGLLIAVAEAGFIAVDVMQHQGKASGTSETTLGYRGSSAIFAALAEMSTLAPLSAEEGAEFGLDALRSAWTIRLRGQRQRDGRIGGEWYFSRSILSLPAEDPRAPGVLASKDVAVLEPVVVARVSTGAGARLDGLRTLWGVQAGGGLILRGQARGGQVVATWAHSILGRAHGWTQAQAEAALADWEREGVIETTESYPDGKHKQRTVEIIKAPPAVVEPF